MRWVDRYSLPRASERLLRARSGHHPRSVTAANTCLDRVAAQFASTLASIPRSRLRTFTQSSGVGSAADTVARIARQAP